MKIKFLLTTNFSLQIQLSSLGKFKSLCSDYIKCSGGSSEKGKFSLTTDFSLQIRPVGR